MLIGVMDFGQLDARHAATHGELNESLFKKVFIDPFGIDRDDYYSGKKIFIYGIKGSGKSAFLKILEIEKRKSAITRFVYFTESLREIERANVSKANISVPAIEVESAVDFFEYWRSFFFLLIAKCIFEEKEDGAKDYLRYVYGQAGHDSANIFKRVFGVSPTLESWSASLGSSNNVSAEGRFEKAISIEDFFSSAISVLKKIQLSRPIYLFIDELEVVFDSHEKFLRDVKIAENLVIVLRDLNETFRNFNIPIYFCCSIRKEVAERIIGGDAAKIIHDLGNEVSWKRTPWEHENKNFIHPLFEIVLRRMYFAEFPGSHHFHESDKIEIYRRYFPQTIGNRRNGRPTQAYILDLTTYRPRDLPIVFNAAKTVDKGRESFRAETFSRLIRAPLRDGLWTDIAEALRSKYPSDQIDTFRKIFERLPNRFKYSDFKAAIDDFSADPTIADLIDKYKDADWVSILRELYILGAIGNVERGATIDAKYMFYFRGYTQGLLISHSVDMVKVRSLEDV